MEKNVVTGIIVTLLIVSMLTFVVNVQPIEAPATPQTRVYIDPRLVGVSSCYDFTVNVNISDVEDLYAWQFNITFDPNLLECVSVAEGPFLESSGPTLWLVPRINNTAGWVLACCSLIGVSHGVNGSGTLANMMFHCKESGSCSLHFIPHDTHLIDPNISDIHHVTTDGIVTPVRMFVEPVRSYVGVGETFSVDVSVAVVNLSAFEFKLGYNTIFLDAIDVLIQPFLNKPIQVAKEEINDNYNATFGFVWVNASSQCPAEGVSGGGAVATVTFRVVSLGGCVFDLYDTTLKDPEGFLIDHSVEDGYYESGLTQVVSTESTDYSGYPSLAVDSSGNVHVAWYDDTDYAGSGTDLDIFYKRYDIGVGWTSTEVISTESAASSFHPSLAVDSGGNVHVAWEDFTDYAGSGTDLDIFYKRYDIGVGWTSTEVISTNSTSNSNSPSLAVDYSRNIHIAWDDSTDYAGSGTDLDIFYKRYDIGVGWTNIEIVSTNSTSNSAGASLAVDSGGNVHVAWYDDTDYAGSGTDFDIFYKRYEVGVGWTSTEVISTESTSDSYSSSLAVDYSRNIHIAWDDSTDYAGSGTDLDIFYKRYDIGVGWTSTEVISTNSTDYSGNPSLAVDSSRNVHIAWDDSTDYAGSGTDFDVFYKRYEVGVGWTNIEIVSTESTSSSGNPVRPSLGIDLARNVHVAWNDDTDYAGCGTDFDIFYKYLCLHSTRYPWSMFRHDLRHTGYTESPAPNTNQTIWNYTTGYDVYYSSPAVADGMVFVGSIDHKVYALDQHTGAHIWNYTTGGLVESSPTVADGRVYVGSADNRVYCLDAYTGAHIWNYTTGYDVFSSPAVDGSRVYVGSYDGKIYCLDAYTGAHIWNYTTGGGVWSSPAVADGRVYVGSEDDMVYCLDASTGAYIWDCTTGFYVQSSPAVADGRVYVGSYDGKIYCLDAYTGAHIWNYTTGSYVFSSPAVADDMVFVGSIDHKVYALDQHTGAHIWNYTTGYAVESSPAVADGRVYVGSGDDKVYCLDAATGAHIWNYTTGGSVYSSPAVADGMVFVGSRDHNVYAFGNIIRVPEDYPTVQEAIDAATPGATIIVTPSIYNETLVINKTLTIIGRPGSAPIFDGGGSGIAIILLPGASGSTIANIVITNWNQGIFIADSSDCTIYDNIMSFMGDSGILLEGDDAANNIIYNNVFQGNTIAINLTESSTGNVIYCNIISGNTVGIDISNSNGNIIYHNNFVQNDQQVAVEGTVVNVWDNGAEGNYWSDYEDRYPYAEEIDDSGIWDTPYEIAVNNIDRYPLVEAFSGIRIADVVTSKNIIGQSYTLNIDITILNYGLSNEITTVTVYANTTIIATLIDIPLASGNFTTLTFTLDTTSLAKGNYTIKAKATPIPEETDTTDNTLTDGTILVTIPGDVDGDFDVDIYDVVKICTVYGSKKDYPKYVPNRDINCDGKINIYDVVIACIHYGQHYP